MTFKPIPIAELPQAHQKAILDAVVNGKPVGMARAQQVLKLEVVAPYSPFQKKGRML